VARRRSPLIENSTHAGKMLCGGLDVSDLCVEEAGYWRSFDKLGLDSFFRQNAGRLTMSGVPL